MSFSDWEMIDDGSFNGLRKWIRSSDEGEGTVQVSYEQLGLGQMLDDNKRAQNHGELNRSGEMWHAAKVPAIVLLEWMTKYGIDASNPNHAAGVKRLLNSNEYAHLKRAPIVI